MTKLFTKGQKSKGDCYQLGHKRNCHSFQFTLSGVLGVRGLISIISDKEDKKNAKTKI